MMTSLLCFLNLSMKPCQRQPTELKLRGLIVHTKFHKICKFKNHVTRNEVIMMSLSKQWKTMGKSGPLRNQTKYISFERFSQNVTFIDFEPLCQTLCSFHFIFFSPNSILNIRKSYKIWGNWLKNKNGTGKKQNLGWKTLPPPQCL